MIDRFLEYLRYERNYSVHTVFAYRQDLNQFFDWVRQSGEDTKYDNVRTEHVRQWVLWLMNDMKDRPSSVHRKVSALSSFYRFLYVKNLIPETFVNPTSMVVLPKRPKDLPKFFLEKEMDDCLKLWSDSTDFGDVENLLIIEMIYQTGLRRSEVAGLKDIEVDVEHRRLKVLGKGDKERIVPFGEDLAEKIENYRRKRDEEIAERADTFFVNEKGESINGTYIYNVVKKMMGIVSRQSKISPHVIRHTFATAMLNRGADLNVIKELLGHESLATTQMYTHVTFEQLQKEYKKSHPRGEE